MHISSKLLFLFFLSCIISSPLFSQRVLEFLDDETLTFEEKVNRAEAFYNSNGKKKHTGYKQYLRWKYNAQRSLDDNGFVLTEEQMTTEYQKFKSKNKASKSQTTWQELGPVSATNTSTWSSHIGRLSNIAIDPNDDQHLLVTSLGGGAWITGDEGANWTPVFDQENTMNLQSALISHGNSNHYFVGTNGMRKSIDGGMNWSTLSGISGTIYTILQDPTDANILLASSSNGRVYRSIDGGTSWNNVLLSSDKRIYDIEFKPDDPNVVYASGSNSLLYKSLDQGMSWDSISTTPWPTGNNVMIATTADDPNYLYALRNFSGGFGGLYLSTDGGTTWSTQMAWDGTNNIMGYNMNQTGGQAPRDMDVIVNPADKTEVHVAGIMTFKSSNSGVDWTQTTHWVLSNALPFVHADIDQLIYKGSKIYVASDGGIFISTDGGASFVDKTTGLGIRQFYRISASTTEVERVAGGSQDNGTGILRNGTWYDFMGADGMEPLVMHSDDDIVFGSIQFGSLRKSIDGGNSLTGMSQAQSGDGEWVTPLERDPILANGLYQGKRHIYKSTTAGAGWSTISNISPGVNTNMDEIAIDERDNNHILVSYSQKLYKTSDGGQQWTEITPSSGAAFINYISIDPNNSDHYIITISNANRILETTDGGSNWNIIKYNLPNITAQSAVFDGTTNNGIFVSMAKGVYYKDDNSPTSWTLMDTNLPKVDVREIEVVNDKLYACTYGRGLWVMDIPGKGYTLNPNLEFVDCMAMGTQDSLDDRYTFQINPNGMGLGSTYSISGDINVTKISYGSPYILDNAGSGYEKHAGSLNLTITDDNNSSYTRTFKVNPEVTINCWNNASCNYDFRLTGTGIYSCPGPSYGGGGSVSGRNASWYMFSPETNGQVTVRSCGEGVDTNLRIHSGACGSRTFIMERDDQCSMGPGLNNYASQALFTVEASKIYFIEWDSKWSSQGFDFELIFEPECMDYLDIDISNYTKDSILNVKDLKVKGELTSDLYISSENPTNLEKPLTIIGSQNVIVETETCVSNEVTDCRVYASSNVNIQDDGTTLVNLNFPANLTETIGQFALMIDVDHPDISELNFSLITNNNEEITFWNEECTSGDGLHFILNHLAVPIENCQEEWRVGVPIFQENNINSTELGMILGRPMNGEWVIKIDDNAAGNEGILRSAYLYFIAAQ